MKMEEILTNGISPNKGNLKTMKLSKRCFLNIFNDSKWRKADSINKDMEGMWNLWMEILRIIKIETMTECLQQNQVGCELWKWRKEKAEDEKKWGTGMSGRQLYACHWVVLFTGAAVPLLLR